MAGMGFRETRLLVESLDAHLPHEGPYMDSAYGIASNSEHVSNTQGAEIGFFEMDLVYYAHEFSVVIADRYRRISRGLTGRVAIYDTVSLPAMDVPSLSFLCVRPVYTSERDG